MTGPLLCLAGTLQVHETIIKLIRSYGRDSGSTTVALRCPDPQRLGQLVGVHLIE